MLDFLADKFANAARSLTGVGRISEKQLDQTLRDLRLVLLEADVHYQVAKKFIQDVRDKALGAKVLESLTPGQMVTKIFHEELTRVMGGTTVDLDLGGSSPAVIMLVGLQGAGKTTTAAKLARWLMAEKRRHPFLVSVDVYRPAAMDQLRTLANTLNVPCFSSDPDTKPVKIAQAALRQAREQGADTMIVDTAGRLAIDDDLMKELEQIKAVLAPREILFVADIMTGQDALTTTETFHKRLSLTGVVLSKTDGDARGGAALSIRDVTGVNIKFSGTSEKLTGLEPFHPDRMASRILDLGDLQTLLEKAGKNIDEDEAMSMANKFQKGEDFDLEDFRKQLGMIKKLGSIEGILKMIPGMGGLTRKLSDMAPPEKEMKRVEAIIDSMTSKERHRPDILNGSRRARIAKGSGTTVTDVNRLIKQFQNAQTMMRQMKKMGMKGLKGFPF